MADKQALILVVDDNEMNRDMLSRRLERQGYQSVLAEDGVQALERLPEAAFDLVLLDIMMPRMNGYEVLERIKADPALRHIPVIMISAVDELDSVVKCIELGADDYLFKPFNPILLKARVNASLEKKRLRDQEQAVLRQLQAALPPEIAARAEAGLVADALADVSAVAVAAGNDLTPDAQVDLLNRLYPMLDALAGDHHLHPLRPVGNVYTAVAGAVTPMPEHPNAAADFALAALEAAYQLGAGVGMGLHTGPAAAGVVANAYDVWGDAVDGARQMAGSVSSAILLNPTAAERLEAFYAVENGILSGRR
jgi:CheY-like chemotaxis protein